MTPKEILDEVREALEDVLHNSVDATTYPDGPCLDREVRRDVKRALTKLDSLEMVEGYHFRDRHGYVFTDDPIDDDGIVSTLLINKGTT